jgi:protein TonB
VGIKGGTGKKPSRGQSNDYIDDLPLGDMTRVNTKEYRYFGFYDRIRKKLEQFWGSTLKKKARLLYKKGRRFPASVDRITSLKVTIDKKGNIIDIAIQGTSGVAELDEAAVESFNKAGPFPNPPSGLVKNGHADIEWGFVVKS